MVEANIMQMRLLFLIPINLPDAITWLIGGAVAFALAFVLTFFVKAFCYKVGWLDRPASRRVHTKAVPRLGGVAMFLAFAIVSLVFYIPGSTSEAVIYWLLFAAALLTVFVHTYDDVWGLQPWHKLLAQTIAVIIILGPWASRFQGVLLFTFNNPFGAATMHAGLPWYQQPTLFLFVHDQAIQLLAIPAIL